MESSPPVESTAEPERTGIRRILVRKGALQSLLVPGLAVLTALIIGAVIIAASNPDVLIAWRNFFRDPLNAVSVTFVTVANAYLALFEGAFGSPARIVGAIGTLRSTGESRELLEALRPFAESLVISAPYIFAGLAVALGFRGGLFNIGAEGQLFAGGLASVYVGYAISGVMGSPSGRLMGPPCKR